MPVIANGNINPLSILAPNVYVQIQPPAQLVAQGLPTNIINYVGTASYGPKNVPVPIGGLSEYNQNFGPVLTDLNDLGTAVAVAAQKFVNTFICVRVTDGTDTQATAILLDITSGTAIPGLELTSIYTGAYANNIQAIVAPGSNSSTAAPTFKVSVSLPNQVPEIFDNIGGTGNTLWANMVAAINNGQGSQSGPSQLVSASLLTGVGALTLGSGGTGYTSVPTVAITGGGGTGATATAVLSGTSVASLIITNSGTGYTSVPTVAITGGGGTGATATAVLGAQLAPAQSTYTLSGGTSGNATITSSVMIGTDGATRTGMYALRNTGIGVATLVGLTDAGTFAAQTAFGLSEGKYMISCGPLGQTLSQATTIKQALSSPSYAFKYMIGDWESWQDTTNNVTRFVPPTLAECSLLSSELPNESGLNSQIVNIAGTQSTLAKRVYSQADIASMMQNGIDVIAYPSPGGNYFASQTGKNTSPILLESDDSYSRLTPFIAYSLNGVAGIFIGQLQTPDKRNQAQNTLVTFLTNLAQQNMIGDVNGGKAFSVILNKSNNPDSQVELGIMQADIRIVTFKVIYVFLINLQNGDVSLSGTVPNTAQNRSLLII